MDIVGTHPNIEKSTGPTVVTCVNNTLGVFPDAIKPRTYSQVWCMSVLLYVQRDGGLFAVLPYSHRPPCSSQGARSALVTAPK